MKTKLFFAVFFLTVVSTAMGQELNKTTLGSHGGAVKQAEGFQIEMKNSFDGFQTFLLIADDAPNSGRLPEPYFLPALPCMPGLLPSPLLLP